MILTLFIWATIALVIGTVFLTIGIRYYKVGKTYHDSQKALLIEAEKRVKLQYNKIATMSPNELTLYLGAIFSRFLELNGELGTERDPAVMERLYANTLAETLDYIGEETLEAIEYYYGNEYVEKWSNMAFRIIEKRRKVGSVMDGNLLYPELERLLAQEMPKTAEDVK